MIEIIDTLCANSTDFQTQVYIAITYVVLVLNQYTIGGIIFYDVSLQAHGLGKKISMNLEEDMVIY